VISFLTTTAQEAEQGIFSPDIPDQAKMMLQVQIPE
jgi:hypothetical protein